MNILPAGIKYYSRINNITCGNEILLAGTKYYSREWNITRGNEYYSREPNITRGDQILLAGTIYYSRKWNITRGNEILLAGMKYYSRKCIYYSRDRKITCGNEILLAGIQYYSRKWIITRGKKYYSREIIITRGNLFITRGNDILLAGGKYWQYMAPEGFRTFGLHYELLGENDSNSENGKYAVLATIPIGAGRDIVRRMNDSWKESSGTELNLQKWQLRFTLTILFGIVWKISGSHFIEGIHRNLLAPFESDSEQSRTPEQGL